MSDLQQYACLIEVWGLESKSLPERFGATQFMVRGDAEIDAAALLVGANIYERQRRFVATERLSAPNGRQTAAIAALHSVRADGLESALTLAEAEVELVLDCMNFFSDLLRTHRQSPLRLRLHGAPPHRELRVAVAEDGDCYTMGMAGQPRNFSIKALHEASGTVRKSIERVETLLRSRSRTEVEERLLRAVRWGGRATAERSADKQLLFMMIALESVVRPTKMGPVTETVAKRAAGLLALSESTRNLAKTELRKLYARRSSVAHVGGLGIPVPEETEHTSRMRSYAKSVILSLLVDPRVGACASFEDLSAYLEGLANS